MNPEVGIPKNKTERKDSPLIHRFYASPLSGDEIEAQSMEIIEKEAPSHSFSRDEWQVVRRLIHTTGDFGLINSVRFSPGAIPSAVEALRQCSPIYSDSRMIQAGLSLPRLRSVHRDYDASNIYCYVNDEEMVERAQQSGLPRSLFAIRKAKPILHGGLAVFGNSPIALLELSRLILEEQIRPALVVAMPVGFVHVIESKEELMSLNVPYIAIAGRRGGSPLAVSVIHALCTIARGQKNRPNPLTKRSEEVGTEAIILMGHGSRAPEAGMDMEAVAGRLREKFGYSRVEICFMSGLGPHLPEVLEKCVKSNFIRILVIPYFLHMGVHLLKDIPEMMQEEVKKFPHIKLILGKSIGFDEGIVNLIGRRINESKDLCDVRDLEILRGIDENAKFDI